MKNFAIAISFSFLSSFSYSQLSLCDSVSQYLDIGGLDCYLGIWAPYTPDSYQWLNCDNNYAPFPNDTLEYFTQDEYAGYVALEVTLGGCVDTSYCAFHCVWGIDELDLSGPKTLVKTVNVLGQEPQENDPFVIEIYSDGTRRKFWRKEE